MTERPTCATCRFWKFGFIKRDGKPSTEGECRAHPPSIKLKTTDGPSMFWPDVNSTDWCGEHQPYPES